MVRMTAVPKGGQHMKRIAAAVVILLVPFEASAVVRYLVKDMTCAEVQEALERDGTAILYRQATSSGLPIYDRYVKSDDFCDSGQNISRASVLRQIPTGAGSASA